MKYNIVIAIDTSKFATLLSFCMYRTPVWRIKLFEIYEQKLLFMAQEDRDYPAKPVELGSMVVDGESYTKVNTYELCYANHMSYYIGNDNFLYIHFKNHYPITTFFSVQYGITTYFSMSEIKDKTDFFPLVTTSFKVQKMADTLEFNSLKLPSLQFELNNTYKEMDKYAMMFGFRVSIHGGDNTKLLEDYFDFAQFYVASYTKQINKVIVYCKDKRETWTQKAPNTRMKLTPHPNDTGEYVPGLVYPYLNPDLNDNIIPDAYGYCFHVPGICLNENEAITNRWRHFRFARTITSNLNDSDFIIEAEIGKKWVQLPKNRTEFINLGYGTSADYDRADKASGPDTSAQANTGMLQIYVNGKTGTGAPFDKTYYNGWKVPAGNQRVYWSEEGTVSIPVIWAHDQNGKVAAEDTTGGINAIRLSAKFNPQEYPGDIIKDILGTYGNVINDDVNYINFEYENELSLLPPIGVYLKDEKPCLDWVKEIQNMSLVGFQCFVAYGGITARLMNPNRDESFIIGLNNVNPILNKDDIEVVYEGDNYATYTEVEYAFKEESEKGDIFTDNSFRPQMIMKHQFDKAYKNSSRLKTEAQAKLKANTLMQQFNNEIIAIKNIQVQGEYNYDLYPYQIGIIDIKELQPFFPNRNQNLRVMLQNITVDPLTGITTLSALLCERVTGLPWYFGEAPSNYQYIIRLRELIENAKDVMLNEGEETEHLVWVPD